MTPSPPIRASLLGTLISGTAVVIALTVALVAWPIYRDHLTMQRIARLLKAHDSWGLDALNTTAQLGS
jgi:hypothetical protein